MIKIDFKQVTTAKHIDTLTQLATTIWKEHYTPIIGAKQVAYMLQTIHCAQTISDEINHQGYEYFLIIKNDLPIGYLGANIQDQTLFLSKLYILQDFRKGGFGKLSLYFLKHLALSCQLKNITLTVNKNNSDTIAIYEKLGFKTIDEICVDIGSGYVMDDYKMELVI